MDSEFAVTCFTDLKRSTDMAETIGADAMRPMREEYLEIGKILAISCGGEYKKNVGDGHMIIFKKIEPAFRFAARLQEFYQPQPNYSKASLVSRIGLFLGVIEDTEEDAFGSGVNQASRVEGKAIPGSILIDSRLKDAASTIWGADRAARFLESAGTHQLKGITKPLDLFFFKWQVCLKEYPDYGLSARIFKQLEDASVTISNTSLADLSNQPSIIWPVVPRDGVNAIHRGQLEIIRLLAMIGCKVHVLIADCGVTENFTREYSHDFSNKIDTYATTRNIRALEYRFMSDLFKPRCEGCDRFHGHFQNVIKRLTLSELLDFNRKDYSKDVQDAKNDEPTLDFLRPALTIASVLHMADQLGGKCIIIAGYDEKNQWEGAHNSIPAAVSKFGVLFNPILKAKQGFQGHQKRDWPLYYNWDQIHRDMANYDLTVWFTKFHLFLSAFPAPSVTIDGVSVKPELWLNREDAEDKILELVNKSLLAKHIFSYVF